jgi:hypothetical protein
VLGDYERRSTVVPRVNAVLATLVIEPLPDAEAIPPEPEDEPDTSTTTTSTSVPELLPEPTP